MLDETLLLETIAKALKLRVALIGEGDFRSFGTPGTATFRVRCVLPGRNDVICLWHDDEGAAFGNMATAEGKPISATLHLVQSSGSLLHNADLGFFPWAAHGDRAPTERDFHAKPFDLPLFANEALFAPSSIVQDAVAAIWQNGALLSLRPEPGPWRPSKQGKHLLLAAIQQKYLSIHDVAVGVLAQASGVDVVPSDVPALTRASLQRSASFTRQAASAASIARCSVQLADGTEALPPPGPARG